MSPLACLSLSSHDLSVRASTIGFPLAHLEARVVDPSTLLVLPIGEKGEIQMRGYVNMLGYYNEPEKTKEVFFSLLHLFTCCCGCWVGFLIFVGVQARKWRDTPEMSR